jgi:glycerate dehydrogenase
METVKIVVLDGHALNPGDLSWKGLEEQGNVTVHDRTTPELVVPRATDAEIVLTNKTPLGREVLDGLIRLRYIGVLATGYDIVDVSAATRRGVVVANVPTYGTDSVAQFVFALLLEPARAGMARPYHPDVPSQGSIETAGQRRGSDANARTRQ